VSLLTGRGQAAVVQAICLDLIMSKSAPFEFDAGSYRQASAHQKEWAGRLIAELRLRGDEQILDLGCGEGAITAQLAELVPRGRVVGIDASANMIAAAQSLASDRLEFRQLDINDLSDCDTFDLVFSNAALHWVLDHRRLLANVRRALRPGGLCRFNFAAEGNCAHFFEVVHALMREQRFEAGFRGFHWPWYMPAPDKYEALFKEAGFTDYRIWGENNDRYFADATAITAWIDQPSLVPFLQHLEGSTKQAFRDEAVARTLALTRQPNGTHFETFRRINVLATE
jgi:trans-aconitate 2-methyltransferase